MQISEAENIDRISHNMESLSKDVHEIKKTFQEKEKEKEKLLKKDIKRRKSLKKAQLKFKNVSTNLNIKDYEKFEKKFIKLKISKSAYLKNLILDDLDL